MNFGKHMQTIATATLFEDGDFFLLLLWLSYSYAIYKFLSTNFGLSKTKSCMKEEKAINVFI